MRGPWDQPVRFCWKTFFQPSEQLSDSCLNCLAFPPVTLAALQFQQFQGWTLAIPTLSYQDTSANTSVISSSSSSDMSSSSPCLHQQNEAFADLRDFIFLSNLILSHSSRVSSQSSPEPTGERSQVWRNVGYPANSSYVGSGRGRQTNIKVFLVGFASYVRHYQYYPSRHVFCPLYLTPLIKLLSRIFSVKEMCAVVIFLLLQNLFHCQFTSSRVPKWLAGQRQPQKHT